MDVFIAAWYALVNALPSPKIAVPCVAIGGVFCFLWDVIQHPNGALNKFMIWIIDYLLVIIPSTPDEYKLANMLIAFSEQVPSIGFDIIWEIFSGITGMLAIYLIVKLWKFLPFT